MAIRPNPSFHCALIKALGILRRLVDTVLLCVVLRTVLVAKGFESKAAIQDCKSALAVLHLEVQATSSGAGYMEGLVTVFVRALYTGSHALVANVAR